MSAGVIVPATYGHAAAFRLFSVAEYQQMIAAGILDVNDRVELLEGHVVRKTPRNPPHDGTIDLVKAALAGLPEGWLLRIQQAVALDDSQPEPDFAVVRGTPRSYLARHPGPSDVGLLIEVSDSSLVRDRQDKARIYARAGIPVYWVINLTGETVEVYAQPSGPVAVPAYGTHQTFAQSSAVPLVLDGAVAVTVAVADLLP